MNDPQVILAIIQAVLTHGVSAVLAIADMIRYKQEVTPEAIRTLKITKRPEEFF